VRTYENDGTFSATLQDPGQNESTRVVSYQGQTLTADEDLRLTFADGSV
jgi:hypothetical protein